MPGAGGYREHDILVITEDGNKNITGFPTGRSIPDREVIDPRGGSSRSRTTDSDLDRARRRGAKAQTLEETTMAYRIRPARGGGFPCVQLPSQAEPHRGLSA